MEVGSIADWLNLLVGLAALAVAIIAARAEWQRLRTVDLSRFKKVIKTGSYAILPALIVGSIFWLGRVSVKNPRPTEVTRIVAVEVAQATQILETPEPIEVTRLVGEEIEVTRVVEEQTEVTRIVEVEVTQVQTITQTIEVAVTATPTPESTPTSTPSFLGYTMDLSPYSVGDPVLHLGTDIVVREDGEKYINGRSDNGVLRINSLVLTGKFNIQTRVIWLSGNVSISLGSVSGDLLEIAFVDQHTYSDHRWDYIIYGNRTVELRNFLWNISGINQLRLEIDTELSTAKLFINNEFYETVIIKPGIVYTSITIAGISQQDSLYELATYVVP